MKNHTKKRLALMTHSLKVNFQKLEEIWKNNEMTQQIYTIIWVIVGWELGKWLFF